MNTFVLIPGAGTAGSAFDAVAAHLSAAGHDAVGVDAPFDDPDAGLPEYVDAAIAAIADCSRLVVVAQSLGAYTGVEVCCRVPAELLVLLCPMIPAPGETPGEWWANTGYEEAARPLTDRLGPAEEWDDEAEREVFLHDCPTETLADVDRHFREERGGIFGSTPSFDRWPDVPTRVLAGQEDRFFPLDFQRRVSRDRLGIEPDEIAGGHCPMLCRPAELAEKLLGYVEPAGL